MTKDQFYRELDQKFDQRQELEEIMKWLTNIYEQTRYPVDEDMEVHIAATSELAGICRSISDFEGSIKYYKEVQKVLAVAFGEQSFEYAVTVNNLAGTYRQREDVQRAETLFLKAKRIFELCHGEKHYLYASALNNLGLLYMDMKREEEGITLMEQSMEILMELGGQAEDVATGLLNQAYYYAGRNKDEKAMSLLVKSMEMFSNLSYYSPHIISAKMLYGQLLSRTGKDQEARECLLLVLQEIKKVFGKNKDYCTTLKSLANHCMKYGRYKEAACYEDEAAQLLDQIQGQLHKEGNEQNG